MKMGLGALGAAWLMAAALYGQAHHATGIVIDVEKTGRTLVVSCDAIPGYMAAMEMRFRVDGAPPRPMLRPGTSIAFVMEERRRVLYARKIHVIPGANLEAEPMKAGDLTALQSALHPSSEAVPPGGLVPDFELTDQAGKQVRLSGLAGRVVLLTFGYSRCPNPDYCVRLSNNLSQVQERFASRIPHDLVLLTIAIDPEHDQGATLAQYAGVWKANPSSWHFLTGSVPEIKQVAALFGMNFWREDGLLTHSLHTVVIDRSGRLAANLEGNHFTVQQLGDVVNGVMNVGGANAPKR